MISRWDSVCWEKLLCKDASNLARSASKACSLAVLALRKFEAKQIVLLHIKPLTAFHKILESSTEPKLKPKKYFNFDKN